MTANTYPNKTQHYLKVKKPLLERQRRARINQCLDTLKQLVAELRADETVLRMDKAELLVATVDCMRKQRRQQRSAMSGNKVEESFRNGYMNAVNEVSRVMASTPGMNMEMGKSVMTHLGRCYNQLQQQKQQQPQTQQSVLQKEQQQQEADKMQALSIDCAPPSPASSGYYSDCESAMNSPVAAARNLWRPW